MSWVRGLLVVQNDFQLPDCGKHISLDNRLILNSQIQINMAETFLKNRRKLFLHFTEVAVSLASSINSANGLYFQQHKLFYRINVTFLNVSVFLMFLKPRFIPKCLCHNFWAVPQFLFKILCKIFSDDEPTIRLLYYASIHQFSGYGTPLTKRNIMKCN